MHLGGLLGGAEPVQLHLVELVDPQQAAGVAARGAGLPAEAGGVGHQPHGQVGRVEDLVADQRGERHLGGGDGPQVVALQVVGVVGELGQVAGGHHGLGAHQGGGPDLLVGVAVAVQAVVDQGPHQPGPQAAVHDEHGPGHAHGPVGVEQPQLGADLPVRHPLVIARRVGVAHRFGHHVVAGPGPVGAVLRGQVADHQQPLADLLGQLVGLGRPGLGLAAQLPAAVLEAGCVIAPPGRAQGPDLFGDPLHLSPQLVGLPGRRPLLLVEGDHLVEQARVLPPPARRRFDRIGIGPELPDVEHPPTLHSRALRPATRARGLPRPDKKLAGPCHKLAVVWQTYG